MFEQGQNRIAIPPVYSIVSVNSDSLIENQRSFIRVRGEFDFEKLFGDRMTNDELFKVWFADFVRVVLAADNDGESIRQAKIKGLDDGAEFSRYIYDTIAKLDPKRRCTFLRAMIENRFDDYKFPYENSAHIRVTTGRQRRLRRLFSKTPLPRLSFKRLLREEREPTWLSFNCRVESAYYINFLLFEIIAQIGNARKKQREVIFIVPDHPIFANFASFVEEIGEEAGLYLICNESVSVFYHLNYSEQ